MLVIPRKKDEGIVIGDAVIVTVVEIQGEKVRLAIEHPDSTSVERGEAAAAARQAAPEPSTPA